MPRRSRGENATVTYSREGSIITANSPNTDTYVHIPVPNPEGNSQRLTKIWIEAAGKSNLAWAKEVSIY
jgi:hypothetical protein